MGYYQYPEYVPVAQKKAAALKKLDKLRKKNPDINPVIITGRNIAESWWGKEWNRNLERYADFSNRIGRGRSYVRNGALLDLKIEPGKVRALVQGSSSRPYSITIEIKKINGYGWAAIKNACRGNMDSIQHLLAGTFPKKLAEIFTSKGSGLFPTPDEISFSCSCPDWAYMCKHVAAVLYGIGARLDSDPGLFFILRDVDMNDLISESIEASRKEILAKAEKRKGRIIEEDALSDMFGITLGDAVQRSPHEAESSDKEPEKKVGRKTVPAETARIRGGSLKILQAEKRRPSEGNRKMTAPEISSSSADKSVVSDIDTIIQLFRIKRRELKVQEIIAAVDMPEMKIRNIIYRLKSNGVIENSTRGVYRMTGKRKNSFKK